MLFSNQFRFIAPSYLVYELGKHHEELYRRTGSSPEQFLTLLGSILSKVMLLPTPELKPTLASIEDDFDLPFLALAQERDCPIWTEDKHFDSQNIVNTISTKDILQMMIEPDEDDTNL
ncbi:MAG: PIN domain-containing protein [Candidatus Woesearchaeota archaeon]